MDNNSKHIVVVGAGISGLCTAYWLKKRGFNVTVFETDSEPGGTMKTIRMDGWLIETGPNSALETTPLLRELFDQLEITDQRLYADDAASKRFIVRNGMLNVLPMGLGSFLSTRLWSVGGKLRLLKEPFIKKALKEESIAEFVTRRLGKEFLDYAINPFVAGVYAGSPEKLSLRFAFPKLYALEANYGSLMRGTIKSRGERKKRKEIAKDRARLFSFSNGMQTLPNRLAEVLGDSLRLSTQVEHIIPVRAGRYPKYTISVTHDTMRTSVEADAVVLSTQAYAASKIIRPIDPEMASMLDAIYYPPVAEIFLGFKHDQIRRPLDGFGFLVPEVEKKNILGCIWSSSLFPDRAPVGHVALTSFVGGSRQPDLVNFTDAKLMEIVMDDLRSLMGIDGMPTLVKIVRWNSAIPQYNVGYGMTIKAMERFEQNYRGTFLCSNYRGGIAVGDCVMNAEKTVQTVTEYLAGTS